MITISVTRPYCDKLREDGYEVNDESCWWVNQESGSGIRNRECWKESKVVIVVTEISKHPKTFTDDMFASVMKELVRLINSSTTIVKIVFQKGNIKIPLFFLQFLKLHGICYELIFDDGQGGINSESYC